MQPRSLTSLVRPGRIIVLAGTLAAIGIGAVAFATPRVATTRNDFYFYGTQPQDNSFNGGTLEALREPQYCAGCHQDYSGEHPNSYTIPYGRWKYSMMAQSMRDPVFHAAFQIAEKDAGESGAACLRCHAPSGFIENRAFPTDGSALQELDKNGVSCIVCHRQVNPVEQVGNFPPSGSGSVTGSTDRELLEALGVHRPPNFANGGPLAANGFVFDTSDRRRGPYNLGFLPFHEWAESPFHNTSAMCASCHDVSNPVFMRQPDGTYSATPLDQQHPTGNKYDMYPLDRTFSEWASSAFANGGVTLTVADPNGGPGEVGRFSFDGVTADPITGAKVIFNQDTLYSTCQDCHQPATSGQGCELAPPVRPDIPVHNFNAANSWVLRSVWDMFGLDSLMDNAAEVDNAVDRNKSHLRRGTDLETSVTGSSLNVRVINNAGHKFPGGFSEGRRGWVNVRFLNSDNQLIGEFGSYNFATADLDVNSTKVYQVVHGLDTSMAAIAGLPQGPGFHLDINNKVFSDNRIPPRGFSNAVFQAIQSPPVNYTYADGQHWDDTQYIVPAGAARAEVRVYYQTTSREYIEFLRDMATDVSQFTPQPQFVDFDGTLVERWTLPAGYTPTAPLTAMPAGEIVYAQWIKWGKSQPVEVDYALVDLSAPAGCSLADVVVDGTVDGNDFIAFINSFGIGDATVDPAADVAGGGDSGLLPDGTIDGTDFIEFINAFAIGC